MADTKISGLSAVTSVLTSDEMVLARAGATKKITGANLAASLAPSAAAAMLGYVVPSTATGLGSTNIFAVRAWLPQTAAFTKFLFKVGTSSGNMDLGVYDAAGAAIRREGSFAVPTAGRAERTLAGGSLTLTPGVYILAMQIDNATATFGILSASNQEAIAYTPTNTFPLPSTLTLTVGGTGTCLALIT